MAIAHAHTDTTADISSAVSSQSVTKPTGFTAGDVGILVICNENGSNLTQTSAVAAMTQIGSTQRVANNSQVVAVSAFWCNGSVGSITIANTLTGATHQQGYVFSCFTGVDTTTPIDVTPVGSSSTGSATLTVTGVTTVTDQAWDVFASGDWISTTAQTATGFTISENAHAQAATVFAYNTTPKSVGATGNVTLNAASGSTQIIVALRFALRPASAATGTPGGVLIARQEPHWSQIYEKWAGRRSPGIYPEPATLSRRGRRQRRSYEESLRRSPVRLAA